jgi:xanthine dehydrogenase YagT iron-sulfur-binding subunit
MSCRFGKSCHAAIESTKRSRIMVVAPISSFEPPPAPAGSDPGLMIALTINSVPHQVRVAPALTLLDLIRDHLGLTGTKKGCDMGACGACTILEGGRRIASCLALAASYDGAELTTIEGIGAPDKLHPLQAAFIRHDALQCGYCTPGQILSAIALLAEKPQSLDAIREGMSGNLCRCGAYPNIVAAIAEVAGL